VVVAANPLPALAPLLWRASALVTASGGPGAHLVDVARSLRVPAVVSAPIEDLIGPLAGGEPRSHVLVVDGGTGLVSAVRV
jgi:phosphoenolpyruvate-protein kinase (PTS system EI component)